MLNCTLTRWCRFLPSCGKWWKTFWNGQSIWKLLSVSGWIQAYTMRDEIARYVLAADLCIHVKEQDTEALKGHNLHHHDLYMHKFHSWLDWASQVGVDMLDNWMTIFIKTGNSLRNLPGLMSKCDCWRGRGVGWTHRPGGCRFWQFVPHQTAKRTIFWP